MAIATEVSIGTSQKVSVDYQSQEVNVRVTYALESQDADLLAFVTEKAAEVEKAHAAVWKRIREQQAQRQRMEQTEPKTAPVLEEGSASVAVGVNGAEKTALRGRNRAEAEKESPPPPEPSETPANAAPVTTEAATAAQQRAILALANRARMTGVAFMDLLERRFGKRSVEQLSKQEAAQLLLEIQREPGGNPSLSTPPNREKAAA